MNCPRCKHALQQERYEGVEIDRCAGCSGVWLDEGELVRILHSREQEFSKDLVQATLASAFRGVPQSEFATRLACPKCSSAMMPVNFDFSSGVVLDNCPNSHGVWLDGGELEKAQIHDEHCASEAAKYKNDWDQLVNAALGNKGHAAAENKKRELRPARHLVNKLIGKLVKR